MHRAPDRHSEILRALWQAFGREAFTTREAVERPAVAAVLGARPGDLPSAGHRLSRIKRAGSDGSRRLVFDAARRTWRVERTGA